MKCKQFNDDWDMSDPSSKAMLTVELPSIKIKELIASLKPFEDFDVGVVNGETGERMPFDLDSIYIDEDTKSVWF